MPLALDCVRDLRSGYDEFIAGRWINADDVDALVRQLDVALNGAAGAALRPKLCDIVGQVIDQRWRLVRSDRLDELKRAVAAWNERFDNPVRTSPLAKIGAELALAAEATADGCGSDGDRIVGHKTFAVGLGFRHEPLTKREADALVAAYDARRALRALAMPDEQAAINTMFEAHERLRELGWGDPVHCPKDGSNFRVIEPGSTRIHQAHYEGEWPSGAWWVHSHGDLWPSRPVLFKSP